MINLTIKVKCRKLTVLLFFFKYDVYRAKWVCIFHKNLKVFKVRNCKNKFPRLIVQTSLIIFLISLKNCYFTGFQKHKNYTLFSDH